MSTGFMKVAALAVPLLIAAACGGDDADANGADANMPADSSMYAPPPPPPATDTTMMNMDSMAHDTMHMDTTPR